MDQIHLWSNSDFITFGFPGSGTPEDPYSIEGFEISTLEDDLIFLSDIDAYFVIKNNLISGENSNNLYGIRLINTQNGLIENNIITEADENGIIIHNSNDILIQNNLITNNAQWGIYLSDTNNLIFLNNTIKSNGFEGVGSYTSTNNLWMNNTITNHLANGVRFELTNSNTFLGNIVNSNGDAGIWLGEAHNNIVQFNSFADNGAGVAISHDDTTGSSTNNLIIENEITNNFIGLNLVDGASNNITNNNFMNNLSDALRLDNSFGNIIEFNLIYGNPNIGISLAGGQDNKITNNIISNSGSGLDISGGSTGDEINCNLFEENLQYGISLSQNTRFETITQNDFVNNQNSPQAIDDGTSNSFQNNFWNELEVENQFTVYAILGSSNNVDSTSVMERNSNSQDINSICYVGPKSIFIALSNEDLQIETPNEDVLTETPNEDVQIEPLNGDTNIIPEAKLILPVSISVIIGLLILILAVPSVVFFHKRKSNVVTEMGTREEITEIGFDDYEVIGSTTRTPISGLCRVCSAYVPKDAEFCNNCNKRFN